jgi:crotonobetainyl-CoA:carnitine CoA-transferase CaiB-like acyl-CoA transferase
MAEVNRSALEGISIIDFSHVFQGPVGTQLLADLGADVIKIERPGQGDWSRDWGPYIHDVSMPFASLNRNKRSVTLDLRKEGGKTVARQLARKADVLVHNFRPGVMERLGLGYDELCQDNPRLVYAFSSGWGDQGPYVQSGRPGHDMLARAEAGWFVTPPNDNTPMPGGISIDYPTGLVLMIGIFAALVSRERTGRGQLVTTDLFSVAMHAHAWDAAQLLNQTRIDRAGGVGVTEQAINKAFRTRDGFIELSPVFSQNALRDISVAMGLGDLSLDPRFEKDADRLTNAALLNSILAARFLEKTTAEWLAELESKGILCGRVRSFEEAARDPQLHANGMIVEMDDPRAGILELLGTPIRLHSTPAKLRMPPPALGEHNKIVLSELGYSPAQIDELERQGVFGSFPSEP